MHRLLLGLTAFALLLSATLNIVRHSPATLLAAEAERHLVLDTEHGPGGHSHDSDEDSERTAGHLHGHNPGDHNHDPPLELATFKLAADHPRALWSAAGHSAMDGRRGGRLDRPPDLLSDA
ncbi:hypothetical protein [Sphingopyxis sp. SCN 67-31]|uniref:hypothetical protein n=1 Tax=Sphingopyxis sp. SCN 67-31 TaxID=1660142 RepID=UPI00086D193B|nr:hypothetical protein [Sphingopyxis sp. SCN 67-31]KAB2852793.1 MAG: hypothetical protein F9K41_14425 [Sphingopyxis terrae]ODU35144.1 MAG: hypothetical protein ABS88_01605 [Sphingopyxis sp. SCN 67-31]